MSQARQRRKAKPMIIHYLTDGRSSSYACGANAVGRRNTRTDCDENQTSCTRCLNSPAHPRN